MSDQGQDQGYCDTPWESLFLEQLGTCPTSNTNNIFDPALDIRTGDFGESPSSSADDNTRLRGKEWLEDSECEMEDEAEDDIRRPGVLKDSLMTTVENLLLQSGKLIAVSRFHLHILIT